MTQEDDGKGTKRVCGYAPCSVAFIPKKPWQRFHSPECRKAKWESEHPRYIIDPKWKAKYGKNA